MDFRLREALRKSRIFLLENVIFDVLTDHLIDQDIFSDSMLDYIKAGTDRIEKIRRMLDNLVRRPNVCYSRFLTALHNSGHEHCALRIQQNYVQSGATQVSNPVPYSPPCLPALEALLPGEDDDIMESSASDPSPPPKSVPMGFPEVSASMDVYAGSFSAPVQESSGEEIIPSAVVIAPVPSVLTPGYSSPVNHTPDDQPNMSVYQRHLLSNPNGVYRMETSPRGLALVINNEKFTHLSHRRGSKRDMENLYVLFKRLGFDMHHQENKTAEEMRALLRAFAEYAPLQTVSALVVVILSHGGRGGIIFGRDGSHNKGHPQDYVRDEEIRDMFSARNCPLMIHKPKLIIIQACRGVNEDMADGVRTCSPSHSRANGSDVSSRLGQDGGSGGSSSASSASSMRIANMADICLIHSTVQGYVSYRHPVEGSPFIQEMSHVFQDMADREHLTDLMTEVNRKLASRQLQEDLRTVPSTTNTLTKKWFFNPPTPSH